LVFQAVKDAVKWGKKIEGRRVANCFTLQSDRKRREHLTQQDAQLISSCSNQDFQVESAIKSDFQRGKTWTVGEWIRIGGARGKKNAK